MEVDVLEDLDAAEGFVDVPQLEADVRGWAGLAGALAPASLLIAHRTRLVLHQRIC
jgi:hypothetical protein